MVSEIDLTISTAIRYEQEAYDHYASAARKAGNPRLTSLFTKLAMEEARHKMLLQIYQRTGDFEEAMTLSKERSMTLDFEGNTDVDSTFDAEGLRVFVVEAISREVMSYNIYKGLRDKASSHDAKELFSKLMGWEAEHRKKLEKLL